MKSLKSTLYLIIPVLSFLLLSFCKTEILPELIIDVSSSQSEKIAVLDKWLQNLEEDRKFNGGVLIIQNGEVMLKKAYGFTDASLSQKLDSHSMFRLASLSKQFTAMGHLILKENGKIDLDDLISEYIPDIPYKDVKIRHLLTHTSGIPDNYIGLYEKKSEEIGILTNEKAVNLVIEEAAEGKKPNEEYSYSNTGFIIAARIIELVSKQSFEEFLRDNLFRPAGMNESRVWNLLSEEKTFSNKTNSFRYRGKKAFELSPTNLDGVAGDGAVFSSLNNFVIWNQFLSGNQLVSTENLAEIYNTPTLLDGSKSTYGLGWGIGRNSMSHSGGWLGARTYINRSRDGDRCIVILDNSASKIVQDIYQKIAEILD